MPNPTGSAEFKAFGKQFMADIILHHLCLRMRHRDLCIFRFDSVKMNTTYVIAMMASQIMANLLFVPHLLQSNYNDKKNIKASDFWPFTRESTDDWWGPLTKGH